MRHKTLHKILWCRSGSYNGMDWESEHTITYSYRPGSSDYWNKAIGTWEQGYGPEVEFVSVAPDAGDHGAYTDIAQRHLEDAADDFLQNEGYDEACSIAAADRQDAADYARELAADLRRDL